MSRTMLLGGLLVDASATAYSLLDGLIYGGTMLWTACASTALLGCCRVASALRTDRLPEVLDAERFLADR